MKKTLMTLAAVLCCSLTTVLFISCQKEVITKTTYSYEIHTGWWVERNTDENNAILNAFDKILGNNGEVIHIYSSNQDDRIKSECEALKTQFANLQSVLLTYHLIRITAEGSDNHRDTLATYFFGRASTGTPYAKYKFESYRHDFVTQLREVRDSISEDIYNGTLHTYQQLSIAFENHLSTYVSHYNPEAESSQRVMQISDSIFNAHQNDTLAVPLHFSVSKIDLFNQTSDFWDHTLPANM